MKEADQEINLIKEAKGNTGDCNTGNQNTGYCNTGDCNTGDCNTGNWNTGYWNTGDCNTGNQNTGDCNTGNRNTGDCNTGNWNTGYCNTGDCNTGNWNTGNWNTGYWNTGDCNTGNQNTGYFNVKTPKKVKVFGKSCLQETWDNAKKPECLYFSLTEWVPESQMSDVEKRENPSFSHTGGYLKFYDYKEAFTKSVIEAKKSDRDLIRALPNFNNNIFLEISGVDLSKMDL